MAFEGEGEREHLDAAAQQVKTRGEGKDRAGLVYNPGSTAD